MKYFYFLGIFSSDLHEYIHLVVMKESYSNNINDIVEQVSMFDGKRPGDFL